MSCKKPYLLSLSLATNLGLPGFFKYGGLFLETFTAILQSFAVEYLPAIPNIIRFTRNLAPFLKQKKILTD